MYAEGEMDEDDYQALELANLIERNERLKEEMNTYLRSASSRNHPLG